VPATAPSTASKGKHTTRSYLTHHTQRIALAASRHEASHIILVINQEKGCLQ